MDRQGRGAKWPQFSPKAAALSIMQEEAMDRTFAVAADETGKMPSNLAGIPMPSGL